MNELCAMTKPFRPESSAKTKECKAKKVILEDLVLKLENEEKRARTSFYKKGCESVSLRLEHENEVYATIPEDNDGAVHMSQHMATDT